MKISSIAATWASLAFMVVACSHGAGALVTDDGGADDSGLRRGADAGRDARASDGSVIRSDASAGSWGPCSLASVGHAQAESVTPRSLFQLECTTSGTAGFAIINSESELAALRPDAGADAGPSPSVSWSTESVVVITYAYGGEAYTFGREGSVLVASVGKTCSGAMAPPCQRSVEAVPKVSSTTSVMCPLPSEPCQAP